MAAACAAALAASAVGAPAEARPSILRRRAAHGARGGGAYGGAAHHGGKGLHGHCWVMGDREDVTARVRHTSQKGAQLVHSLRALRHRAWTCLATAADAAAVQVTIGGSVARGAGSTRPERAFPAMFFSFLNATFPHP